MMPNHVIKRNKENAQGMVEFALILPLLLLVILGIVEFGRALFFYSSVTSASREAARYGSAVGEFGGVKRYADCAGIRDAARSAGAFANIEDQNITIQYDDGANLLEAQCPPTTRIGLADRIVVTVDTFFRPIVPLLSGFFGEDGLPITSTTARTIITQVGVKGTPAPTVLPPGVDTPTATHTPSSTPTETPTNTATSTAIATATPEPTSTGTLVPPTATGTFVPSTNTPTFTPTPACGFSLTDPTINGLKMSWDITNHGPLVRISEINMTYHSNNGDLVVVAFGTEIWSGVETSPTTIVNWNQGTPSDRELAPNQTKTLSFTFQSNKSLKTTQLSLTIKFEGDVCPPRSW
jgi:Flp pilus assembly protein TadG